MTMLLDHGVPRRYLQLLTAWGYEATVSSMHIAAAATDMEVLELAKRLNATLLTVDLDFANVLDYPPAQYGGIIVLRYQPQDENRVDVALRQALTELYPARIQGALVIVAPDRYRVRR